MANRIRITHARFSKSSHLQPQEWRPDDTRLRLFEADDDQNSNNSEFLQLIGSHPNYECLKELARGGFGVVYLVFNRLMGRNEVLKVIRPGLVKRPEALSYFLDEISIVGKFNHGNIVNGYGAFRIGETTVLSMEYVEGYTLKSLVGQNGPISIERTASIAYQCLSALEYIHSIGIAHGDITPSNLMLSFNGRKERLKIVDFGLARNAVKSLIPENTTLLSRFLGTPNYSAPEQIDGEYIDGRTDIYSLGCTLYYLLSGHAPFQGETVSTILDARARHALEPLHRLRPDIPLGMSEIVEKMMAFEPDMRFQTPSQVASALKQFMDFQSVSANILNVDDRPNFNYDYETIIREIPRLEKKPPDSSPDDSIRSEQRRPEFLEALLHSGAKKSYKEFTSDYKKDQSDRKQEFMSGFLPALREELHERPHGDYPLKLGITRWINAELKRFDLAITSKKFVGIATLSADDGGKGKEGRFQLKGKERGKDGEAQNFYTQSLTELLDEVIVVDAPPRREAFSELREKGRKPKGGASRS